MEIFFDEQERVSEELIETMRKAAEISLRKEGLDPEICEISVSFTDGERIRELNREYRGVDRVTDVLSFPQFDSVEELEEMGYAARFLGSGGQELCGEAAAGGLEDGGNQCFFISADTACTLRLETAFFDPAGAQQLKTQGETDGVSPELMQRCAAAYGTLELSIEP